MGGSERKKSEAIRIVSSFALALVTRGKLRSKPRVLDDQELVYG
jgi:hypothetical protein